ncbi:Sua5/YciO/YrdC/YwlC family protein [Arsenophonus symbiont of Ornithomya chloropus]|uniref:Sua5/YciO/YrdC/YwlC family protein n=1 Tax=Arsenophonus symbiont of Ornithomya chloropus TaxID=634121 RepID=UPI0032B1126B
MFNKIFFSFHNIIVALKKGEIIAYPTEAVFGLGCDPDNEQAIHKLFLLKKRSWKKGLILIASSYEQLIPYIDDKKLTIVQKKIIVSMQKKPITWVLPAKKNISKWLIGTFDSIAVRITNFPLIKDLCCVYGKPLISTSANLHGEPPCRTTEEVISQFNDKVFILDGVVGGYKNPSEIRDIIKGCLYRKD